MGSSESPAETPSGSSDVVGALEASRRDLIDSLSGLAESHANTKTDDSCWSALQCIEHVVTVEERFMDRLTSASRQETSNIDPQREAMLASRLASRETKARAPEAVHPTGRFATLDEAIEAFNARRSATIEFARNTGADLYYLHIDHARFGRLNGVELLLVMAGHARRHAEQIREVRQANAC